MSARLLVVLALVAFLAGLAIRPPLSVALALSGARQAGLDWRAAEGSLWSGAVRGLSVRAYPLGDVQVSLWPVSLLTLSPALDLSLDGPEGAARGRLVLRPGGAARLSEGAAEARVAEVAAIDPRLRARGGALSARAVEIVWRKDGCVSASGRLASDALTYGFSGGWRGPALAGDLACEEGVLIAALGGAEEGQEVAATARLGAGAYRVQVDLQTDDEDAVRIASLMGFAPAGEGWRYDWAYVP